MMAILAVMAILAIQNKFGSPRCVAVLIAPSQDGLFPIEFAPYWMKAR